jgi:ribosomal protein L29
MKKLDLLKKKPEELESLLKELKQELFKLNSSSLAGEDSLKKKAKIKVVKRDIARIKTILNNNA